MAAYCVILNPRSGRGRAPRLWRGLAEALAKLGVQSEVHATSAPGDATRLARASWQAGFRHFLAVGGDGTVNEVLNGLEPWLQPEANVANGATGATAPPLLAVLPAGTGNDWARVLGLPRKPAALAAVLAAALAEAPGLPANPTTAGKVSTATRRQDVGELTFPDGRVHLFVEEAGAGFDAHVLQRLGRNGPRALAYVSALLRSVASYQPPRLELHPTGAAQPIVVPSAFLAIGANGAWTGGGMRIAPHALADDGWLDFVTVRSLGWFELLRKLPKLFNGRLLDDEAVRWCRANGAELRLEPPGGVQADGQIVGTTPVRFGLRRLALQVPKPGP